jgi:hypothetical protein
MPSLAAALSSRSSRRPDPHGPRQPAPLFRHQGGLASTVSHLSRPGSRASNCAK